MANLPVDLVFREILGRLPVKSVCRLMCVSKVWHSFLKTPEFARLHLSTHLNTNPQKLFMVFYPSSLGSNSTFYALDYEEEVEEINGIINRYRDFPFQDGNKVWPLCSCDGMVLLWVSVDHQPAVRDLVLLNPSTGDYKNIESIPMPNLPYLWAYAWAFYYDCSAGDYRVVKIDLVNQAHMYSLRSDSWRKVGQVNDAYHARCIPLHQLKPGVYLNGCLYWIAWHKDDNGERSYAIQSFDLNNFEFKKICLPDVGNRRSYGAKLTVHQERLHVFLCYRKRKGWESWMMMNDGNIFVWEKTATILPALGNLEYWSLKPICYTSTGKILMKLKKYWNFSEIFTYNPMDHKMEQIFRSDGVRWTNKAVTYIETLVSPNIFG